MLESDTLVASCTEIRFGSPDREKNANSSAYHMNFSISRIRLYRNRDSRQLNASHSTFYCLPGWEVSWEMLARRNEDA